MKMNRRNVLVGLGGIVASGGALLGTGAFSTVEADRTANISTTNDSSAYLGLEPVNTTYVAEESGEIVFYFDGTNTDASGLNDNAVTTFGDVLRVTNDGSETVGLSISAYNTDASPEEDLTSTIGLSLSGVQDLDSGSETTIGFTFDLVNGDSSRIGDVNVLRISADVQDAA